MKKGDLNINVKGKLLVKLQKEATANGYKNEPAQYGRNILSEYFKQIKGVNK